LSLIRKLILEAIFYLIVTFDRLKLYLIGTSIFISRLWKNAFLLLSLWYLVILLIAAAFEYLALDPEPSTFLKAIPMALAICLLAYLAWRLSTVLTKYSLTFQVLGHLGGIVLWFIVIASISYLLEYGLNSFKSWEIWRSFIWKQFGANSLLYNLEYITAIALFYLLRYIDTVREKENEKMLLAIANNEMQMSLLKSQINPHFLFNTLNSISTLMATDKAKARQMMAMLGDVFRYALDSNDILEVPLTNELEFIRSYIRIQQVRFGDRLKYEEDIERPCLALTIPPMVLQPLVENSVKHGITPKEEGGTITVSIHLNNGQAIFKVADDGIGLTNQTQYESSNSGVGLANSDMRLQSMYGKQAKIRIAADEDGFDVTFRIPVDEES
jgi:two-component system LytT family sensor kinase